MAGPPRKFSLLDAMAFVAATAVGLGIIRSLADVQGVAREIIVSKYIGGGALMTNSARVLSFLDRFTTFTPTSRWIGPLISWPQRFAFWSGPLLAAWTLGAFGLGVRKGRRIARRPGSAAGLAVLLAMAATATLGPQVLILGTCPGGSWKVALSFWWPWYWSELPRTAAFGVVVAWSVLAWGGRWAPVPGWHDRLGRTLGVGWIAMGAAGLASGWLEVLVR